jgi:hypothetical protein
MCVFLYNLTLFYSVSLLYFFWAATAFDIFGTDNAEELLPGGFQYPSLPISILHFVTSDITFYCSPLSGGLCCCVSFWFWREIGFGCTYYYVLGVPYSCFLLWRASFITTGKKSSSRLSGGLCCCVGLWFWREIGFGFTYYYVLGVPYSCGFVLVFFRSGGK